MIDVADLPRPSGRSPARRKPFHQTRLVIDRSIGRVSGCEFRTGRSDGLKYIRELGWNAIENPTAPLGGPS
ncbi:hypothetical protein, partial [Natronococcus amylolyticus]|uniref:hypothetical protein n=1 Tax=Natronococcus amylolyticus TaxID=44470 RepID=UPI0019D350FE